MDKTGTKDKPLNKRVATALTRRRIMLDAATELFLEKGFERTSLADIIKRSKGSRSTLYEQFGNKEGMLRAMIEETCKWETLEQDTTASSLTEDNLVDLGIRFISSALSPTMLAVYQVVTTERYLIPDLAKFYFETGPKIVKQKVIEQIRKAVKIDSNDVSPEEMAVVFIGAIIGDLHFRLALGSPPFSSSEIKTHVQNAVRIFLYGTSGPQKPQPEGKIVEMKPQGKKAKCK